MPRYKLVDKRTGDRLSVVTYLRENAAYEDIEFYKARHAKGKRLDITLDLIENMTVVPEDD